MFVLQSGRNPDRINVLLQPPDCQRGIPSLAPNGARPVICGTHVEVLVCSPNFARCSMLAKVAPLCKLTERSVEARVQVAGPKVPFPTKQNYGACSVVNPHTLDVECVRHINVRLVWVVPMRQSKERRPARFPRQRSRSLGGRFPSCGTAGVMPVLMGAETQNHFSCNVEGRHCV